MKGKPKPKADETEELPDAWERFEKAADLIELERDNFLLDRVHCEVRDIVAHAHF